MILPQFFDNPFQIRLSFHKMIERLEEIAKTEEGNYAKVLIKEVEQHPELKNGITDISQIIDNTELISRLTAGLFPALLTLNEIKAISIPYQGLMFNYTERFRNILHDAGPGFEINIRDFDEHQFYIASCCLILNRFYNTQLDFIRPLFYDIPTSTGLIKHYRILYNADFMEIIPPEQMPLLSAEDIKLLLNNYDNLALWKEKFPPASWVMKGFTIITLIDVTVQNAVSILKDSLLDGTPGAGIQQTLESILQSIFQIANIRTGLTLFDRSSGKISISTFGQKVQSFLLPHKSEEDHKNIICADAYQYLIKQQTYFAVADIADIKDDEQYTYIAETFGNQNIKSFILAPVAKNGILHGFLEVVSSTTGVLNSVTANKLEFVMPFLVDAIDRKINDFDTRVQAVIQNNYTNLHPSVNWKFMREAKNYIQKHDSGEKYNFKEIRFRKVFPLYGEVDIHNSSITRNLSVKNDLENQVEQLISLLELLQQERPAFDLTEYLAYLKKFTDGISFGIRADTEQSLQHYLEIQIFPLLQSFVKSFSLELNNGIKNYLKQSDSLTGNFFINRRNYEETLMLVNNTLLEILDRRQSEIQKYYAHYYERFKTDGVDHSLYIGAAITPDKDFNDTVLSRLRLWQLLVTVEMVIGQYYLKDSLPYHLGVTSLILVYSTPIDIRFRMDEKHFDIDGAYNIRYEVVKKRIDKAHIKDSTERITQQGKITIVYSKEEEAAEYNIYINMLQKAGILEDIIEEIDIEELQGVSGLKALCVGILYDPNVHFNYNDFYEELYLQLS